MRPGAAVLFSLLLVGCGGETEKTKPQSNAVSRNKDKDKDKSKDGWVKDKHPDKPRKPDVSLASTAFGQEFKTDREAAKAKYQRKYIELEGEITGVGRKSANEAYLTLEGPKDDLIGVTCFTKDREPWNKYSPGQKVKLQGDWPEFAITASLIDCTIVEAGPNPAPVLTAEELAKESSADAEATIKKYDKKWLVLSGEIVGKETNDVGAATLELKGDGKTKVRASFTAFEKDITDPLKVGQKVELLGQFTLNFGKGETKIYFCMLRGAPK
jgi:hypothetical protein